MNVHKCLILMMILCLNNGVTGDKHKDHIKVYVPEFIHHDHHVKVITIHHHHHKPKKEHHHHHHHHHPKPYIPFGHHYHHQHHKKAHTTTKTSSKGHHGNHYGHHGRLGHHGHNHYHKPVPYDPPVPSTYGGYGSYSPPKHSESPYASAYDSGSQYDSNYAFVPHSPSVTAFDGGIHASIPVSPKVRGITHVVKQVNVFDSHPGVLSNFGTDDHGYEVTEFGNDGGNGFNSANSLQQNFPGTYDYVRGEAEQPSHEPFAELISQGAVHTNSHDPFAGAIAQPTVSQTQGETFTDVVQSDPSVSTPFDHPSFQPPPEYPANFQDHAGFDEQSTSFVGDEEDNTNFLSEDIDNDTPVTFHREAGIQQSVKTGGVETVVY